MLTPHTTMNDLGLIPDSEASSCVLQTTMLRQVKLTYPMDHFENDFKWAEIYKLREREGDFWDVRWHNGRSMKALSYNFIVKPL